LNTRPRRIDFRAVPPAPAGIRIGLFGGSFDPAHRGHAHVAKSALRRLNLHQVWWLVTPQNPLKPRSRPLAQRMASAQGEAQGPRMRVTSLETRLGLAYTVETVAALKARRPGARFVLILGGDGMASFHRWKAWRRLAKTIPIFIVSRPGAGAKARLAKAFAILSAARVPLGGLLSAKPPAFALLTARDYPESSTALRAKGL
jgi:nicotinate-nucleotide adenylyltransferase